MAQGKKERKRENFDNNSAALCDFEPTAGSTKVCAPGAFDPSRSSA